MILQVEDIIKQITIFCRLTENQDGYMVIYHLLDGDQIDYEEQDINHILINAKMPRWSALKLVSVNDIN